MLFYGTWGERGGAPRGAVSLRLRGKLGGGRQSWRKVPSRAQQSGAPPSAKQLRAQRQQKRAFSRGTRRSIENCANLVLSKSRPISDGVQPVTAPPNLIFVSDLAAEYIISPAPNTKYQNTIRLKL